MIHKKIEQLIPYISREFLTYPLWEEGQMIPFVNFWQIGATRVLQDAITERLECLFLEKGYIIQEERRGGKIIDYVIFPDYMVADDCGLVFKNENWSIEEIIDLLIQYINK